MDQATIFSCVVCVIIVFQLLPSKIANTDENALYFIDFWATWCAPCVYANEYLEVLQKQYPNDFYVVSLSEENPDKVRRHLEKHPTDLAVSIDYNGETFNENNIRVLPYGVLLNAYGKILWKGSPTDFKKADLERYLRQNAKEKEVNKVLKVQKIKEEVFKAATKLQKKIHPDMNRDMNTERLSQLVNEAKDTIIKEDFS